MANLIEENNKMNQQNENTEGEIYEEYKKLCLEHWIKNIDKINSFFAKKVREKSIFISSKTLKYSPFSPFSDLPVLLNESNMDECFTYYLDTLNINYSIVYSKSMFWGYNKGFSIDINSKFPSADVL